VIITIEVFELSIVFIIDSILTLISLRIGYIFSKENLNELKLKELPLLTNF